VQAPVAGVGNVGHGNDYEEINRDSLSLGSDTEYMEKMYVIDDSKVERNGSLKMESLLGPEITKVAKAVLDEQFV
jgi:hypothetical protein